MNQNQTNAGNEEMLDEYDFSNGIRGKYVSRFKDGCNVIIIDPDVADIFNDSESVNKALRSIAHIIRNEMNRHNQAINRTAG
jgi:deoxyadenosine/deoxycytidine kinase